MTVSAKSFSVIICAYASERWSLLTEAVASVQAQTYAAYEIIVVIDHNPALLRQAQEKWTDIRVIANNQSRGLSGARNSGVAAASGDVVAFLDDDAMAEVNWLASMHDALLDSQILGVGTAVRPAWEVREPAWFPVEFQWVVGCTYRGMPQVNAPIRNPVGASMCIRRMVFQAVGGFRNGIGRIGTLPIGCEETELCIRARQHWPEGQFLYLPQTSVSHYVPQKRATWRYFFKRCYAEGISKAAISRLVGTQDALSSESAYTIKTLPAGVLRNLGLALLKVSAMRLVCAAAIIMGFGMTVIGYLIGKYAPLSSGVDQDVPSFPSGEQRQQEVSL
ncbi:glycosyltransferase family 2 protein [Dictyobacter arantiisoli]|uniref:Glycosyl transferase family 2 n=1 Tax=Dictyobacter arantiisoli TaxID=2014874 RepID=A0A5A5T9D6_9CHLR|nr:glycosyltransferase family 2 protein [Dictyobacter arantiisoli]GCF08022.1 glycosyl transferase family 2 [Dictyobacter arantiisoli]